MIKVTAFGWVPPFAQGLVRDLRVRWALEEAGVPYEERLIGPDDQRSEGYLREQPFGQVPAYHDGELSLFESGAIVMHIAERSEMLMPRDANGRARTQTWMFAALDSIEPAIASLVEIVLQPHHAEWAKVRRPVAETFARKRLAALSRWMHGREYLEERFTAGDLLMTTVLRNLRHAESVLAETPDLVAYRQRCEARPAFAKALDAQMAAFARNVPRA